MSNERSGRQWTIARAGALIILVVAVIVATVILGWGQDFSAKAIIETIRSWGPWGAIVAIGLMVLHSFLPIPAEIIALANGLIYGAAWGTLITWVGAMLGAWLAFGLARVLGRPFVERILPERHRHLLDRWTAEQGTAVLFAVRLIPIIAFNLINYAAGLTRVSWWTFTWTTALGILPLTVLMVVAGEHLTSLSWPVWLALIGASVIIWLAFRSKPLRALVEGANRAVGGRLFGAPTGDSATKSCGSRPSGPGKADEADRR